MQLHHKTKWKYILKQCKTMTYEVYFTPVLMPKETYGTVQKESKKSSWFINPYRMK